MDHATLSTAPVARSPLALWKKVLFSAIATVSVILAAEGTLRCFGFGGYPRFFQPLPGPDGARFLAASADGMIPYFQGGRTADLRRVGSFVTTPVEVPKPTGTLRVVVVGESSVQGFPWPRHLAAPGLLESMLREGYPGKRIEVINCGVTAVASFPLRQVAEESLTFEPDAAIVYVGHNEFYGAYGVASGKGGLTSVGAMQRTRWLRGTATVQAMFHLAERGRSSPPDPSANPGTTTTRSLMEQMASRENIGPDDALRRAARKTLTGNLDAIVQTYRKKNIPVLLCTVGSNLRDLRPVRTLPAPSAVSGDVERLSGELGRVVTSGPVATQAVAKQLLDIFPNHAGAQFVLGRSAEMQGDTSSALLAYTKARDLDAMPWRATTELNDAIRGLAKARGVPLLDMEVEFLRVANGAPGWDFFTDHVHPSLEGQIAWASAMANGLIQNHLLPAPTQPLGQQDPMTALGGSRLHLWRSAHLMASLFQRQPLSGDQAAQAYWYGQQQRLLEKLHDVLRGVAESYVQLAQQSPNGDPGSIEGMAGDAFYRRGDLVRAGIHYRQATRESIPLTPRWVFFGWQEMACRYLTDEPARPGIKIQAVALKKQGKQVEKLLRESNPELLESMAGLSILAEERDLVLLYGNQLPDGSPNKARLMDRAAALQQARLRSTDKGTTGPASNPSIIPSK
jgi:hypothetical protein